MIAKSAGGPAPAAVVAPAAPSVPSERLGPARRTPPRLRVFFLRHFRACGEVKLAAEQTGIALSTLYRWRKRDAAFRERWDGLAEQRRQMAEDRLMRFVREGEKTAVFHKGEQVGWRQSHTPRAALAALAYFDRREKAEEKARGEGPGEGPGEERKEPFRFPLRGLRRDGKGRRVRGLRRAGPAQDRKRQEADRNRRGPQPSHGSCQDR